MAPCSANTRCAQPSCIGADSPYVAAAAIPRAGRARAVRLRRVRLVAIDWWSFAHCRDGMLSDVSGSGGPICAYFSSSEGRICSVKLSRRLRSKDICKNSSRENACCAFCFLSTVDGVDCGVCRWRFFPLSKQLILSAPVESDHMPRLGCGVE